MKRVNLVVRGTFFGIMAVALISCNPSDSADDDDDDNNDDNDNDSSDDDNSGLDCESDVLFHFGVVKLENFKLNDEGQLAKTEVFTYEYDNDKKRTTSTVELWQNGELETEYERTYTYEDDLPVSLEWVDNGIPYRLTWEYDDDNRFSRGTSEFEIDDEWEREYIRVFKYDNQGRAARRTVEYSSDEVEDIGRSYEYYHDNLLKRTIHLDPDNDWDETDTYIDFEYDDRNRLIKYIQYIDDHKTGQSLWHEWICEYKGDSAQLTKCEGDGDTGASVNTYERDGDTLTVTNNREIDGEMTPTARSIWTYSDNSNSAFYEDLWVTHFSFWTMNVYGNGMINGCIGLDD